MYFVAPTASLCFYRVLPKMYPEIRFRMNVPETKSWAHIRRKVRYDVVAKGVKTF